MTQLARDLLIRIYQAVALSITILYFYYVSPANVMRITGGIMLITITIYILLYQTSLHIYRYIVSSGIGSFLLLNYLIGFDLLNTILLACFIIGVIILIRNHHRD